MVTSKNANILTRESALEKYFVFIGQSISDALVKMESNQCRTVIVLEKSLKVAGVVSQGDVLRKFTNGATKNMKIEGAMSMSFKFVNYGSEGSMTSESIKAAIKNGFLLIPVVDEEFKLVGVLNSVEML